MASALAPHMSARDCLLKFALVFGSLFSYSVVCFAAIRPSFSAQNAAWQATEIVLVDPAEDGSVRVIESIEGHLRRGDFIELPPIVLEEYDDKDLLQQVKQERAFPSIVFLTKAPSGKWAWAVKFGGIRSSAVWINGEQALCFQQFMNPGPSELGQCRMTAPQVRQTIETVLRTKKRLADINSTKKGKPRAEALREFIESETRNYLAKKEALEGLGKCGVPGLSTIREMLDSPRFVPESDALITAYVEAGGSAVGKDLESRFQNEILFWRQAGPKLRAGWWNSETTPDSPLRNHYVRTLEIARALRRIRYSSAIPSLIELRDFWRSLPQLNDPSGLNQMADECDAYARELGRY